MQAVDSRAVRLCEVRAVIFAVWENDVEVCRKSLSLFLEVTASQGARRIRISVIWSIETRANTRDMKLDHFWCHWAISGSHSFRITRSYGHALFIPKPPILMPIRY